MTIEKLCEAVKNHSGMEDDEIRQAGEHGADAGWSGFTYYNETCEFFQANKSDIIELVKEYADEFGQDPVSMVAGFNCLTDDAETRDEIGRAIYGTPEDGDTQVQNALAWFALEEVGRSLEISE